MRITRIPNTLALLFAFVLMPLSSYASLVNYTFSGTFNSLLNPTSALPLTPSNKSLSGTVAYNTSTQSVSSYSLNAEGIGTWTYQSTTNPGTQAEAWNFATLADAGSGLGTVAIYSLNIWFSTPSSYLTQTNMTDENGDITYLKSGTISNPQPVPLPAAWLMMLTGLVLLIPLCGRQLIAQRQLPNGEDADDGSPLAV